jgi:biopolymer transport protein ExbD
LLSIGDKQPTEKLDTESLNHVKITPDINVDLPESNAAPVRTDDKPLEITVDKDGKIYIAAAEVSPEEVLNKLTAIHKHLPDKNVIVKGDQSVSYGLISALMGDINAAGFTKITLWTQGKSLMLSLLPTSPEGISELDYIKNIIMKQITACWNIPAGAVDAGKLIVDVDIDIEKDGSIKFIGFVNEGNGAYYQVAADAARRAILDPRCNPLREIPPLDKFEYWNELTVRFDPSQMIY